MQVDTVVNNCKIVRHNGILEAGLAVRNGKVVAVAKDSKLPSAGNIIDGEGNYVLPGIVDAHFHLQYPPEVDPVSNIRAETRACAAAGCTTLIHLLAPADNIIEKADDFIGLYEKNAYVDLALSARIYTREHIDQISKLHDYGIHSVKLLLPYKGSEAVWKNRIGGIDDGIIYLTLKEVGRLARQGRKVFVRVHCENVEIFLQMKGDYMDKSIEPASWNTARPRICEEESMQKCLYLAEKTGCPLYVVHLTIKEGPEMLARSRAAGVNVIAETCIQYLTQNVNNVDPVLSKVNPPIREPEDNEVLWEALKNGIINVVATDHAPVLKAMKTNIWDATVGIPGAETLLPLMLSEGVNKGRISLERLVDVCCYSPARIFGLAPQKGILDIGSDADLVIVDLEKEEVVPERPVYSNSDFSTVAGKKIKGWPTLTMLRGKTIAKDGRITGNPGCGRYVPGR
jgi:dihydropyrimidinase